MNTSSERWVSLLFEAPIHEPEGRRVHDFAANWSEWAGSIIEYSRIYSAPVLGRSTHDRVEHDIERAPVWGRVLEIRELTLEEAELRGIEQTVPRALYAKLDVWDGERILYVSPEVTWNYISDDGRHWPCVVEHVAVVGGPLQQVHQKPQTALESLAMSRRTAVAEVLDSTVEETADLADDAIDAGENLQDTVDELRAVIDELRARIAELEGEVDDDVEVEEVSLDMSRATAAQLRSLVRSEFERHRRERDSAEIERVARSLNMSRAAATALHSAMTPSEWVAFASKKVAGPAPTGAPVSLGMSRARKLSDADRDAAARAYARKNGVSYTVALRAILEEV